MHRAQHPAIILIAAALFLRALVPTGWMPAPGGSNLIIQPCPAADLSALGPPGYYHHHPHGGHEGDCAFAPLHAGFASVDAQPALAPRTTAHRPPLDSPAIASLPTGPPALPPPATGPPSIT